MASGGGLEVAATIVNGNFVESVVFDNTMLPPISGPELLDLIAQDPLFFHGLSHNVPGVSF